MSENLLDLIKSSKQVAEFSESQLDKLCAEIRSFLIESISKTGGHIGTNLGVIELTVGLHQVFDIEKDRVIFDTGHQGYVHKLLTGRKHLFPSLNQAGGMSRFLCRSESEHDHIDASHAGTAISIASGMAYDSMLKGNPHAVVAIVGDGSMVEGMSFEGLNYAAEEKIPLLILVNDNGMAITPNVGGIKNMGLGPNAAEKSCNFFSSLGFQCFYEQQGNDVRKVINVLTEAKKLLANGPVVVHLKTEKGIGLELAKTHKYKMHFSMAFDPESGAGVSSVPLGKNYAAVAGETLAQVMAQEEKVHVLTPSTPYASGLDQCLEQFPKRTIDVGMAEQHAAGMACGMALSGLKPFICYQSTFLQRAMDQLIHDIGYMDLPVTILAVRSGFAGLDSPTHHGIYDISYLRGLPGIKIFYPGNSADLQQIIRERAKNPQGPMIILHPYENIREDEEPEFQSPMDLSKPQIHPGKDGYFVATGNTMGEVQKARNLLSERGVDFGVVNLRWIKPFPAESLAEVVKTKRIVTAEENVRTAGLGSSFLEFVNDEGLDVQVVRCGIPDGFVEAGNKPELVVRAGIDAKSMVQLVSNKWKELF